MHVTLLRITLASSSYNPNALVAVSKHMQAPTKFSSS